MGGEERFFCLSFVQIVGFCTHVVQVQVLSYMCACTNRDHLLSGRLRIRIRIRMQKKKTLLYSPDERTDKFNQRQSQELLFILSFAEISLTRRA